MNEIPKETAKIGHYLEILSRRRWYFIIPFCVSMAIGIYFAITLPRIYSAETVVFFQPQELPKDYVRSIQKTTISSMIDHISQEIKSRDILEIVVRRFFLTPDGDYSEEKISSMINWLRRNIEVKLIEEMIEGDLTTDTFTISYEGDDPGRVMHITNALAELFIEKRIRKGKETALDTSLFIEEEIDVKRKQLDVLEQKIKAFREKHMGGLPGQLENNLRAIDRLENQLTQKQEHLLDAKNRLILLNSQLSEIRALQQTLYLADDEDDIEVNPIARLLKMKTELNDLKSRYTPQHPDIVRLRAMIEELEKQIETGDVELPETMKHNFSTEQLDQLSPMLVQQRRSLLVQANAIKLEIKNLNIEMADIQKKIANYQKLVDETPLKEQELMFLQRDYGHIKRSYDDLLNRKMDAQLAVNLEEKQKGEKFSIIRNAVLPKKPIKPNLTLIFLFTVFIAIHLGAGLVLLPEYFDTSVRHVSELESDLGIPVLVTIPKICSTGEKARQHLNSLMTLASIVVAVVLCTAFVVLVVNGLEGTMELINEFMTQSS